jgi:hypothetical protein
MARCEVCGNDYALAFQVITAGVTHTFDSFECAIHKLAPICEHCGCKVVGHGVEARGVFYCCAHCAHARGAKEIVDNAEHAPIQARGPSAASAGQGAERASGTRHVADARIGGPTESWRGSGLAEDVGRHASSEGRDEEDPAREEKMREAERLLGLPEA